MLPPAKRAPEGPSQASVSLLANLGLLLPHLPPQKSQQSNRQININPQHELQSNGLINIFPQHELLSNGLMNIY